MSNELQTQAPPDDFIKLRGGIEVCLRNAFTGEDIIHDKGENVVLYVGRDWVMRKIASAGMASTDTLYAGVKIGTGSAATAASHVGLQGYFTFRTGGFSLITNTGSTVPYFQLTASWASTDLDSTQFNSIWEFALGNSSGTSGTHLCRYLSNTYISATTSNELLVTYTVSF